ncbi:GNAT family N-acetyltransferase [Telmatospirillum sp.]|uniref:GNAT family N-acetyltransferase n=1 Tax=Telmatospirillum sp. TaxID=2079197 RepID=UPI0028401995|nr:GNAT family N-acetyltransferase [Telmatospirillum sp.]MDR3438026.1 GNAT family N-acetyltransferase [Telmatospirillum sp.]
MTLISDQVSTLANIDVHRGYEPGLIGWVGGLNGSYYAEVWGSGAPFEIMISREFCDFVERYDPQKDLVLSAHIDGVLVGSISVLGCVPDQHGAQLRFFLVDPKYHGRGAGKVLLATALDWCRERGFRKAFLWTVDNLPQSRRLYEKTGFRITERCADDRYTVPRDNLKMELSLV